jgi:formate C-acetyltransferase
MAEVASLGDCPRVALSGIDFLLEQKQLDKAKLSLEQAIEAEIRLHEQLAEQIHALRSMEKMAAG